MSKPRRRHQRVEEPLGSGLGDIEQEAHRAESEAHRIAREAVRLEQDVRHWEAELLGREVGRRGGSAPSPAPRGDKEASIAAQESAETVELLAAAAALEADSLGAEARLVNRATAKRKAPRRRGPAGAAGRSRRAAAAP